MLGMNHGSIRPAPTRFHQWEQSGLHPSLPYTPLVNVQRRYLLTFFLGGGGSFYARVHGAVVGFLCV